jgi:heavy metal sensor kinase
MMWRRVAPSIRVRLTGWYAAVLTVMMIVYATATFVAVRHEFLEQLDDQLHDEFETAEAQLTRTADGRVMWNTDQHQDPDSSEARIYEIWSATGDQIHRSGASAALPPVALASIGSTNRFETISAGGGRWRALTGPVTVGGHAVVLRVSRSEERLRTQLWEILVVLVLGLPLVVVLAGVGGYGLARRALAPIDHLASEARRITADRLHQRLTSSNPNDEIGRLTAVINDAVARLESSFEQLRRFTADASHELRTPLAVVRAIGEAVVVSRRSPTDYEEAIGSMLEEVDRMTSLIDTLLRLSRADAGTIRLSRERLDLGTLAREVASSLSILAEERNLKLAFEIEPCTMVSVDRLVLREAITNLLDNGIKFSPSESTINIRVDRSAEEAVVEIGDAGPGIPLDQRERIFDRFFRVDEARSRDRGGVGLGLAIAKWAVDMHCGQITVDPRSPAGSTFRIVLPLAATDSLQYDKTTKQMRAGG